MEELTRTLMKQMQQQAEQHRQQMQLLTEMVVKATTAPAQNLSEEKLMESLADSMETFHYDACAGHTFEAWYRRYRDRFEEDARALDDPAKIRLCFRKLDTDAHNKFTNLIRPRTTKDLKKFEELVAVLTETFGREESLLNTRYNCLMSVKDDVTDFMSHAAVINSRCEDFQLKGITGDQFKCLIYVCSLQSPRDAEIRTRLLAKLDSETSEDPMTLKKLVAETKRILSLKRDTALIGSTPNTPASINAVRSFPRPPREKGRNRPKSPAQAVTPPPRPCWLCGALHFVRNCDFATHKCSTCHKIGHKEGYCRTVRRRPEKGKNHNPRTRVVRVHEVVDNRTPFEAQRRFISVIILDNTVKLQIDTASDLTMISEDTWRTLGSPGNLVTRGGIKSATSNPVPVIAEFNCTMEIVQTGQRQSGNCLVTNIVDLNILGIDWISRFGIWDQPLNAVCNELRASEEVPVINLEGEFPAVFSDTPSVCTQIKARIHLKAGAKPVYRAKRPVAYAALEPVEQELRRLEKLGIISPTEFSEWAAPIVVVKRPNGKIRICADYSTGLNACVESNPHPLPILEDIFAQLAGSRVFSKIDLSDAYLQVEVDEDTRRFLSINTHKGLFTFNRLAPGIKSAPGCFQQIIDAMLAGLGGTTAYFDDILIFTKDLRTHEQTLRKLFQRLGDFGFKVKREKCELMTTEVRYLGIVVNRQGIKTDPAKIEAITAMPAPENINQLRSFLGAINFYGKFVKQMHDLREPLDWLLHKEAVWEWTPQCQQSFEKFKSILLSDLLLMHYDPSLPIKVAGDASNAGVGACITHVFPDGSEKAVAHASRSLTKHEKKYSQIEKEGLALIFALKKFHRYLFGRKFTLVTDHKPLIHIFGSKQGIPLYTANRLQRWALMLASYEFQIQYTSTHEFGNADVLSRLIATSRAPEEEFVIACIKLEESIAEEIEENIKAMPITRQQIVKATRHDRVLQQAIMCLKKGWPNSRKDIRHPELALLFDRRDGLSIAQDCLTFGNRIVIPFRYRKLMLRQLHEAHLGVNAMKMLARSHIFWPKIDEAITNLGRACNQCAKTAKMPIKTLLRSWPQATRPMERIHTDIAGPIGGKWYLITVDAHSMYPEVHEINTITSRACMDKLAQFFALFGNPETIVTDNGRQFVSAEFKAFCDSRGIDHIKTPPYHPMSNGRAERFVDTFKRALKKMEGEGANSENTSRLLHAYRSCPNRRAHEGKAPAELFIGRPIRTQLDLVKPAMPRSLERNTAQESQFNKHHGARQRTLTAGDQVYAKIHRRNGEQ